MIENRDKYLGFTFNGISLGMKSESDFRGFIVNSQADLAFSNGPQYTDEFVVPQYGDKTFYTGTTKSNRTFSLKISLDKINMRQYEDLLKWLNPNATGNFSFDYKPNYGMEVKISSISQGQFYVVNKKGNNEDFYFVDFDINFTTVYDWASKWIKNEPFWANSGTLNLINNDYEEPFIKETSSRVIDGSHTIITFEFNNKHKVENYFTVEFHKDLRIIDGSTNLVNIVSGNHDAIFYSEYGITLNTETNTFINGELIQIIKLLPNSKKTYKIRVLTAQLGKLKIIPISREIL